MVNSRLGARVAAKIIPLLVKYCNSLLRLRRCNATRGNLCEKSSTVHLLESDRMGDHEKSRLDDPKVTPHRLPDPFRFCFFRVEDLTEAYSYIIGSFDFTGTFRKLIGRCITSMVVQAYRSFAL